jgi:hypothetical protein
MFSNIWNFRQWTESRNPVILSCFLVAYFLHCEWVIMLSCLDIKTTFSVTVSGAADIKVENSCCSLAPNISIATFLIIVRFEALTPVVLKGSGLWNMTLCRPSKVSQSFGGTCRHRPLAPKVIQARNQHEAVNIWVARNTDEEGNIFLRDVGWLSVDYMALYPWRQNTSILTVFVLS